MRTQRELEQSMVVTLHNQQHCISISGSQDKTAYDSTRCNKLHWTAQHSTTPYTAAHSIQSVSTWKRLAEPESVGAGMRRARSQPHHDPTPVHTRGAARKATRALKRRPSRSPCRWPPSRRRSVRHLQCRQQHSIPRQVSQRLQDRHQAK